MIALLLVHSLVLSKAQYIEGYKPIRGCFIVNLSLKTESEVQGFLAERPQLGRPSHVWSRGFAVREMEKSILTEATLYAPETISVEECGLVKLDTAKEAAGVNKRAIDRLDQLYRMPDGWMRRPVNDVRTPIYLVDSGLSIGQQNSANVVNLYSYQPGVFTDDGNGHGSFMFEMIRGIDTGPAREAPIYNLRAFSATLGGGGGLDTLKAALEYIYQNRATLPRGIINMSLGQVTTDQSLVSSLQIAVDDLIASGFVVVASAGNEGVPITDSQTGLRRLPAALSGVVTVGGVSFANDAVDARWSNSAIGKASNFGPEIDLFAPGDKQPAFDKLGNFTVQEGTSGAAAYVSGVLATVASYKPSISLSQQVSFLSSKLNNSGIADARSANTGMLFSDLGYVPTTVTLQFSSEDRLCQRGGPRTPAPKSAQLAIASHQGDLASYPYGIVVVSLVQRFAGCPNLPVSGGSMDFVVERFDRNTGARLWKRTFEDPNPGNSSLADHIGFIFEWNPTGTSYTLALGVATNEPGRFIAGAASTADLDLFVVPLDPATGATTSSQPFRLGGAGNQIPRAAAPLSSPSQLAIVGITDTSLDGAPLLGGNDIVAFSLETNFTAASPISTIRVPGVQRLGAASYLVGSRGIAVVGGTTVSKSIACQSAPVDSIDSFLARVAFPSGSSPALVSALTFESPTGILPAIQLDDWVDSIASSDSSGVVVGVSTRQFDCISGGVAYTGTDSAQALRIGFDGSIAWYQSRGLQNLNTAVALFPTGEPGVTLDYHLVAKGVAWKFNAQGTHQAFVESVPAGLSVYDGEANAWFGDASRFEARTVR